MDDRIVIFIAVTSAAVVLQMLILAGMYFAVRKLTKNLLSVADEVKTRALPLLDEAKTKALPLLQDTLHDTRSLQAEVKRLVEVSSPKVEVVLDNAASISTKAHEELDRIEVTVNDLLDRGRLQVIRADEMLTRAMDHVEDTTEKVAHSVTAPVKHASGIVHGISAGLGTYFGNRRGRERRPADEMFI